MPSFPSTSAELIVKAARRAIIEQGAGQLTLSAVAIAAGVSRPTLYRWFPTKADLFEAVRAYEAEQFEAGLVAMIGAHRAPSRQFDAALRYLVTYLDRSPLGPGAIEADLTFALHALNDGLQPQAESFARLLADALNVLPAVRDGWVTGLDAAEMFVRLAFSHFLLPSPDPEHLLVTMRHFAGLPGPAAVQAVG